MLILKKILLLFASVSLIQIPIVNAEIPAVDGPNTQILSGSEYYVGSKLGKTLISVKLLNGVTRPGVYHVPEGTNLSDLIAYAGGANDNANLDEIIVKRIFEKEIKNYEVDLEKIFASTSSVPELANNDSIYIDTDIKLDQTLRWVSIISGVLTIALTAFLISDRNDD